MLLPSEILNALPFELRPETLARIVRLEFVPVSFTGGDLLQVILREAIADSAEAARVPGHTANHPPQSLYDGDKMWDLRRTRLGDWRLVRADPTEEDIFLLVPADAALAPHMLNRLGGKLPCLQLADGDDDMLDDINDANRRALELVALALLHALLAVHEAAEDM